MSKNKESEALGRSDILIEGSTAVWEMRIEGDITGTYAGSFRFKCYLSPLQQIAANREYRELMGPNPTFATEHESFLAYALTQLKHRVLSSPPFWSTSNSAMNGDIADENVISAVLGAAIDAEIKYKNQMKKKRLDAVTKAKEAIDRAMEGEEEKDEDDDEDDDE